MTIKFSCPKCKRALRVHSSLGGKKSRCPGCQQLFTIPTAVPDLEAVAAAALVDQPKPDPAAAAPPKDLSFPCPYCDEQIKMSIELAGKQAPCPQCRRIIKVPLPEKTEPKDWRTLDTRPGIFQRRDNEPEPEGAWGSAVSTSRVSQQALLEADAVPVVRVRLSRMQQTVRAMALLGILMVFFVGYLVIGKVRVTHKQEKAMDQALALLQGAENGLTGLPAAHIHRAAGEFYLRDGNAEQAKEHLSQARNTASEAPSSQADLLLLEVALLQGDLVGTQQEVDKGTHLKEKDVQPELERTLTRIRLAEVRLEALRQLSRKLIAKGLGQLAVSLPVLVLEPNHPGRSEAIALLGLEYLRAGRTKEAEGQAGRALQPFEAPVPAGEKPRRPRIDPALVALLVALDKADQAEKLLIAPPPDDPKDQPEQEARVGYAWGWALKGQLEKARGLAQKVGPASHRLEAVLAVGEAASSRDPASAAPDLESAKQLREEASKETKVPSWQLLRLIRLGTRVGRTDKLQPVVEAITDSGLQAQAQLDLLRSRLAGQDKPLEEDIDNEVSKGAEAQGQILELLTRHQARLGGDPALQQKIADWEPPALRAFGYAGTALGVQDGGK